MELPSAQGVSPGQPVPEGNHTRSLVIVTVLFFMWGC